MLLTAFPQVASTSTLVSANVPRYLCGTEVHEKKGRGMNGGLNAGV